MENQQVATENNNQSAPDTSAKPLSQKDAVRKFAAEAASEAGVTAAGAALRELLQSDGPNASKEIRAKVRAKLYAGFKDKSVAIKANKTDGDLKKYCSSLINNWLKKDNFFA